jgi:hypothetical protein
MWASHIAYASAIVFDVEVTHESLAGHRCQEGNIELGEYPSRKELYLNNFLEQFVPGTFFDWILAVGYRPHTPRWVSKIAGYTGAIEGSITHIRGGIEGFTHGCI